MWLSLVDVGGLLFVLWSVAVVSVIVLLILLLPVCSLLHADSK